MSGWSRTVKPSADKTIPEGEIFGVDTDEISQTDGPAHVGWVRRKEVGSRVVYETLVAMKSPPIDDGSDDTEFPGGITPAPTAAPTAAPTPAPTEAPTPAPTEAPTPAPTPGP